MPRDRATGPGAPAPAECMDPVEFARDILKVRLWSKQEETLAALTGNRRVAVKSGNGLGKGYCAAVAALWFLHTHNPATVLSTAPTFRQVRHVLWRQIHLLYRPRAELLGGKMLDTRWELAEDRYAMGLSADSADQFQGFHSPNMFIVVDEAEGVDDDIYEAIEGIMTADAPRLLLIGNPTTTSGVFRRAFHEERRLYHTITISALDSPNVATGRVVFPGLASAQWVQERREVWGEDNPIYRARVLGEFPDNAENSLISLSNIERAARHTDGATVEVPGAAAPDQVVLGVDVARFGGDRSVMLHRRGNTVLDIQTLQGMDTMQVANWVANAMRRINPDRVYVDEIGVGAGVVDRLREQGLRVTGVNVAHAARQKDIFLNRRAEGYWRLRDLFTEGDISIPQDNQLMGELAAMRYEFDKRGRLLMESKEDMRKRGIPSPDKADALMLAFIGPRGNVRLWTW